MTEDMAERMADQVRARAFVIVDFLAQTRGAVLSNDDRVLVDIGINAGIAALAEHLKEAGVLPHE